MGCCSQFWLLMWKNVVSAKRRKMMTAFELIIPAFFMICTLPMAISILNKSSVSTPVESVNYTIAGALEDIDGTWQLNCTYQCLNDTDATFAYTVVDPSQRETAKIIMKELETIYDAHFLSAFIDNSEFNETFKNYTGTTSCQFLIYQFGVRFVNIDKAKSRLAYEMWIPIIDHRIEPEKVFERNGPFDAAAAAPEWYCATGLLSFQHAIDWTFGRLLPNESALAISADTILSTRPQKAIETFVIFTLQITFVSFALSVILTVTIAASQVSGELESGMKDYLMTMGMGRGVYIASHVMWAFAKSVFGVILCTIPMILITKDVIHPGYIVLFVICYTLAMSSIGVMIGILIKSSGAALRIAFLVPVVLIALVVPDVITPFRDYVIRAHVASLNPVAVVFYFIDVIMEAMYRDQSVSLLTAFAEIRYVYTFGSAFGMCILDAVLFFALTFFADWFLHSVSSPIHTRCGCRSVRRSTTSGTPLEDALQKESTPTVTLSNENRMDSTSQNPATKTGTEKPTFATDTRSAAGQDAEEHTADSREPFTKSKSGSAKEVDEALRKAGTDIVLRDVHKTYMSGTKAVCGMNMECYRGQVTVLLGHNGAGKSTVFNMITGIISPSSGEIEIAGHELSANLDKCRRLLGYCPQTNPIFGYLTAQEHLKFFARLKGVANSEWRKEAVMLANLLQMTDKMKTSAKDLSGGMKRKLSVMISMIGQAKIIVLDEPTAGMDPGARKDMAKLLHDLKGERTFLLTTHYTDEAEYLGDRIVIMHNGKAICSGTPDFLKRRYGLGYVFKFVMMPGDTLLTAAAVKNVVDKHVKNAVVTGIHALQFEIEIPKDQHEAFPGLLSVLEKSKAQLSIKNFGLSLNSMEQVFLKVGAHKSEDAAQRQAINDAMAVVLQHGKDDMISTGCRAFMSQIGALLKKRFLYSIYHPFVLFFQLVIPPVLLYLSIRATATLFAEKEALLVKLDLTRFGSGKAVVVSDTSVPDIMKNAKTILREFPDVQVSELTNQSEPIVDWFAAQPLSQPPLWFAYRYDRSSEINEATFLSAPNFMPAVVNNFVARLAFNARIETSVNFLLPKPSFDVKEMLSKNNGLQKSIIGFVVVLMLTMLTSPFIIFPIVDRTSKFAHQQFLTGLSPVVFWAGNFLFDFLLYAIGCSAYVAVMLAVGQNDLIYGYLTIWGVYFLPCIFFAYTTSYMFTSPTLGQSLFLVYQTVAPLVLMLLSISSGVPDLLDYFFYTVFPAYAVAMSLPRMQIAHLSGSFWTWANMGKFLCLMSSSGFAFAVLFVLMQFKAVRNWFYRMKIWMCFRSVYKIRTGEDEDSAVERARKELKRNQDGLVLCIDELTKYYSSNMRAVDRLSLGVEHNECFGLLGVNGAGKTSTFNVITGVDFATFGSVQVNGVDITKEVMIGYCPQFDALLPDLSGRQCLRILAALHGYREVRVIVEAVIRAIGMQEHAHKRCKNLSGGQRRKISVGAAILAQRSLIILDEPTAGIDPKARRDIWQLLMQVRDHTKSALLLTSHSMEECEALCSRIGILNKGRLIALGTSQELKDKFGNSFTLTLVLRDQAAVGQAMSAVHDEFPEAIIVSGEGSLTLSFMIPRGRVDRWSAMFGRAIALSKTLDLKDFCFTQSTLEQAFLKATGAAAVSEALRTEVREEIKTKSTAKSEN